MKPLLHGWRYAAVCSLLAALPVYAACSAPAAAGAGSADSTDNLTIAFSTMYSGYDGTHDFKLPAKIDGAKNIKWSASPSGIVSFSAGDTASETMITIKNAPTTGQTKVKITGKVGSESASADLTITGTTPDVWQEGSDRYNDGVTYSWGPPDGGFGGGGGGGGGGADGGGHRQHPAPDPHLACTNCHNQSGENAGEDVEHTPTQTGGYSDDDLVKIITTATKPDGVPQRIMPLEQWQKIHKWEMDPQQLAGIVVYLRSLEPKSQGPVDFPGPHGGGGHKGGSKSSSPSASASSSASTTN